MLLRFWRAHDSKLHFCHSDKTKIQFGQKRQNWFSSQSSLVVYKNRLELVPTSYYERFGCKGKIHFTYFYFYLFSNTGVNAISFKIRGIKVFRSRSLLDELRNFKVEESKIRLFLSLIIYFIAKRRISNLAYEIFEVKNKLRNFQCRSEAFVMQKLTIIFHVVASFCSPSIIKSTYIDGLEIKF